MKSNHIRKMQLGRRAAYLKRCIAVLELLEAYETDTSIRKRVFQKHIKPVIGGSYTTFNNMLNEHNPYKQLEDIEQKMKKL